MEKLRLDVAGAVSEDLETKWEIVVELPGHWRTLQGIPGEEVQLGVGDVCFFLTMRCFNDAMFSNS